MGWFQKLLQQVSIRRQPELKLELEPGSEPRLTDEQWRKLIQIHLAVAHAYVGREHERAEDAWEMREREGITEADAKLLFQEAVAEVQGNMEGGRRDGVLYSDLDHDGKLELLSFAIDWTDYVNRGMSEQTLNRIIENAVDGRPPERWQEPTLSEEKARSAEIGGETPQFPPPTPDPLAQIRQTVNAAKAQEQNKGKGIEPEV
ncbi:hypothetical protein J8F10_24305 [Gemmata sp. G18]|uniref:EF-hand domain-containing protein n=1 Tax=Gemmata palustris TaxID=2822762 RepID=A0ABS5BXF4_9BACT|nr:hypothetical protein [Gemmata palustris]MBP3958384.1 hypothetical protein [Gemmata palustris]